MCGRPTYQSRTRETRNLTVAETLTRTTVSRSSDFDAIIRMRADMLLVLRRCITDELANEFGVDWPLKLYWSHASDRNGFEKNGKVTVETSNPEQCSYLKSLNLEESWDVQYSIKTRLELIATDWNFNLVFSSS